MTDTRALAAGLLDWIEEQTGSLEKERWEKDNSIGLNVKTDHAEAQIDAVFLEQTIVEYRILNEREDNVFYLHFELEDIEHAKELFKEMQDCLHKQTGTDTREVLLCCSCGLTTSFFTMKLNEAAEALGEHLHFDAVPYEQLYESAEKVVAVLLAPQIGYRLKTAQDVLKDKIVLTVPVKIFSTYDAAGMISMLKTMFAEQAYKAPEKKEKKNLQHTQEGSVLIVSVIHMEDKSRIAYRIYDEGNIVAERQITKETYAFADVIDTVKVAKTLHPNLKTLCLVTPGMVNDGILTYEAANIIDLNAKAKLKEIFDGSVRLYNDADMIALGYAATERDMADTAFYFVPRGSYCGNIGLVINGNTVRGKTHMGGRQTEAVTSLTTFPQNPYTLVKTPEGNIELAARYITGLYSFTGIPFVACYSSMIPDIGKLRDKIAEFIPDGFMPEIVKADSVRDYLYKGVLYSLHRLTETEG